MKSEIWSGGKRLVASLQANQILTTILIGIFSIAAIWMMILTIGEMSRITIEFITDILSDIWKEMHE